MGNLFGKKKKETRITEQDKAVLQLKVQRDKLRQYTKKLEASLEKEKDAARALLKTGRRERVKLLLRKKRFQEGLIQKTENQLETIERMVHDIEFAQIETNVVQRLKEGNDALKKMHELLSIEDVEKIMDETAEGIQYQQEIDDLLAGGLTQEDEDDVAAELEALIMQNAEPEKRPEKEPDVSEDLQLPEVPDDNLEEKVLEKKKKAAEPVMLAS